MARPDTLLCLVLSAVASSALAADPALGPLADALKPLRATHGINEQRDAGPELTPVKQRLRQLVEQRLATLGQSPAPERLQAVAADFNRSLAAADLTCGDLPSDARCVDQSKQGGGEDDARGYVGDVALSSLEYGRYLLVETAVGVRCGYDQSAYVYEWRDKAWRLLLQSEQDRYGKDEYQPQNFLSVEASPARVSFDQPAPPPLVLTLGYSPWCQSNWQMLYTRLWRTSPSTPNPPPLINTSDTLYMGDDVVAGGSLTDRDVLIEFRGRSIDGDVLVRPVVRHFLVLDGDKLERIAPVALNPKDFVDEWLTATWTEAAKWTDARGDRATLSASHQALHKDYLFGEFDPAPMRCRDDPTLWQVGYASDIGGEGSYKLGAPAYFLVRWMPPYRFTMVDAGTTQHPHCDEVDLMPDNFGTLSPLQDRR